MNALLDQLRELEAELHHAGRACPPERLQALLHPDFHEVGRSGRAYTQQTVVDFLATQADAPVVEASAHAVTLLAEGCALLTYRSALRRPDGIVEHALRSSIWRLGSAGWQLYYHQGTPCDRRD